MKPNYIPKNNGKYRIPSARLSGYDYAQNGAYFVTICTKKRVNWFGGIVNNEIQLSDIGKIAKKYLVANSGSFPICKIG